MKVHALFLSLIILSSFVTVSAHARDWDQCIASLRGTEAHLDITSNFSDGEPQTLKVEVFSRSAVPDFEKFVIVTQRDTPAARIYEGNSNAGHLVLTIQASTCTSGRAPFRCAGVAQFAPLNGGALIPVTCQVNIPYIPASGSHRP